MACLNPIVLNIGVNKILSTVGVGYQYCDIFDTWCKRDFLKETRTINGLKPPSLGSAKVCGPLLSFIRNNKLNLNLETSVTPLYEKPNKNSKRVINNVNTIFFVDCHSCQNCLVKRANELGTLFYLEYQKAQNLGNSCFLTLTYSDKYLGDNNIHQYKHIQNFKKRLFERLYRKTGVRGIKFVCVGEWGEKKGRKHWHILFFGWKPDDLYIDKKRSTNTRERFRSKILDETWPFGWCDVDNVSPGSIFYVSQYVQKKFKKEHDTSKPYYHRREKLVYSPGMGRDFLLSNLGKILDGKLTAISIPNPKGKPKLVKIPSRFFNWLRAIIDIRRCETKYVKETRAKIFKIVSLERLNEKFWQSFEKAAYSWKDFSVEKFLLTRMEKSRKIFCNTKIRSLDKEY